MFFFGYVEYFVKNSEAQKIEIGFSEKLRDIVFKEICHLN